MTLPASWIETTIDQVVLDLQSGFAQRPGEEGVGTVPQIRTHNINPQGKLTTEGIKHVTPSPDEVVKYSLEIGDVIFNNTNSEEWVGKAAVFDIRGEYVFSNHITRLKVDKSLVQPEFLASYLQLLWAKGYSKTRAKRWVSQAAIDLPTLKGFRVPLPTIPEQERIVEMLRQVETVISGRSERQSVIGAIANEHFAKLFGDIFDSGKVWPSAKLGTVSTIVRGSSPRPQGDARYFGGSVPRLMVSDLTRDGLWVNATTDSLTEEGATLSRPMPAQSVVIAVSGAPGLAAILNHDACIHDGFVGLRDLDNTLIPEFVAYSLNLLRARSDQQAVGAVFRNLTTDQVKAITIPKPPLELQTEFKRFLFQVKSLEAAFMSSSGLLYQLRDTLRIESFSGELTAGWRAKHDNEIAASGKVREQVLRERGTKVSVRFEEHAPPERAPLQDRSTRYWVINQLSDFQGFVHTALHEFKGTLLPDDAQALDGFCRLWPMEHELRPHDRVRRVLDQLAELGLIAKVTVQNTLGDFVTGYRSLRPEEETRLQDAGRLQALLRKQSTKAQENSMKENDANKGAGESKQ